MRAFEYTFYPRDVIFGTGSVDRLAEALDRFSRRRALLCASGGARRAGQVDHMAGMLGGRLVATFDGVAPHVPEVQVGEALALANEFRPNVVIGLGGGSPIGLAKALAHALTSRGAGVASAQASYADADADASETSIAVVAIPTTYAGSEMTPVFGVTREIDGTPRKVTVTDPGITPRLVVYDPALTLDLPPTITASTGINALAHCVEALYSITANPVSTATALEGARIIGGALPRCYVAGDDLEARTEMLGGAYLAGTALAGVKMGLHHGLCHVLGGSYGVPHGIANAIVLQQAMRFNLDATAPELARLGKALGIERAGRGDEALAEAAMEWIGELIERLGLPRRLREAGVGEAELPALAQLAFANPTVRSNPKPVADASQLEEVLRAAW
jgi:alcohol dehydrogenase class IV